jgi:hypothetical protein
MSKSCSTSTPVATHFDFASVCIKIAPFKIGLLGPFDQNETICTDRDSSPAGLTNEPTQLILFQKGLLVVNENEVIPTPAHFHKRNFHYASGLTQVQISNAKCQLNGECPNAKIILISTLKFELDLTFEL